MRLSRMLELSIKEFQTNIFGDFEACHEMRNIALFRFIVLITLRFRLHATNKMKLDITRLQIFEANVIALCTVTTCRHNNSLFHLRS